MSTSDTNHSTKVISLFDDDRFSRFDLISWWDQSRLARARVVVVGAGALGNEIVKNLTLLGVGNIVVIDMDRIEASNLTRSVLFRARDVGRFKCEVAAERAREIWPELIIRPLPIDVINSCGAGVFRWADVVIGGLDNREARLAINRHCFRLGVAFIDGGIETIQGIARVFKPDPAGLAPCYECTLSRQDWELIQQRRACSMLTRQQLLTGHTPTTPTIASIIAGIQVQEAVRILHGMNTRSGCGLLFTGDGGAGGGSTGGGSAGQNDSADATFPQTFNVDYTRKPDCPAHETISHVLEFPGRSNTTTASAVLSFAAQKMAESNDKPISEWSIDPARDIVRALVCPACGNSQDIFKPVGLLREGQATCPCDGKTSRRVELLGMIKLGHADAGRKLLELGFPPFEIVLLRRTLPMTEIENAASHLIGVEISGDLNEVLGDGLAAAARESITIE